MAQERKKRRIVLASILKPVDDTRMFEKMGMSLATKDEYEVFIVGFPAFSAPSFPGIRFLPLQTFPRLSFQRWFAKWKVFARAWKIQPSILIFNTHELIWPAIILKICLNTQIVYDVRENYYRNILYTDSFLWFIRIPLALLVRWKEKLTAPIIDHYFLAEKGYENEFRFHRGRWTVIENKALASMNAENRKKEPVKLRLLFSGTLAESTGVFRAISLAKELHRLDSSVSLTVVGYAALNKVSSELEHEVNTNPWITLVGGNLLVPHTTVAEYIQKSDFGIISYPPSRHTQNSKPTKLFEYLSAQLPIIVEQPWPWIKEYESYEPFVFFDAAKSDYQSLLMNLHEKQFYSSTPRDVTWSSEEQRFLEAIRKCIG